MITYRGVELVVQRGTLNINSGRIKRQVHVPYSNQNHIIDEGRVPTTITATLIAYTEADRDEIEILLHSSEEGLLYIGDRVYKEVESGENFNPVPRTSEYKDDWLIGAEFIAKDPIPYDSSTGEPLYA